MDDAAGNLDEAQCREPLQRMFHKSDLGTRVAGAPSPVRLMVARQPAHQRVQLDRWAAGSIVVHAVRQILRDKQGDVTVGADLRHPYVGQLVARVDHRDSLSADLSDEPGSLRDSLSQRRALRCEVCELGFGQLVEVDDRLVEQPPGQPLPDCAGAEVFGVGFGLGSKLAQAAVDVMRDDHRRAAGRGNEHCHYVPLDVVEDVAGLANERIFVARHAREHTELEQQAHDCDDIAALLAPAQLESYTRAGEALVPRRHDDPLGEAAERDLGIRTLQDRQRQAHEHIAATAERELRPRLAGRVGAVRVRLADLEQPR